MVGFHTRGPGITLSQAQDLRSRETFPDDSQQWWFAGGHLYEVFLVPIYFGPKASNSILGTVAIGYEINAAVAHELARVAAGQVAVVCSGQEVVSTINSTGVDQLQQGAGGARGLRRAA
jgi:hypothetical protein